VHRCPTSPKRKAGSGPSPRPKRSSARTAAARQMQPREAAGRCCCLTPTPVTAPRGCFARRPVERLGSRAVGSPRPACVLPGASIRQSGPALSFVVPSCSWRHRFQRAGTRHDPSVVVRATGASAISIEEGADDAGDVLRLIEQEQVSAAVDDVKARVRDPRGEHTRVAQRDARIVVAADDEGR